jgi:hypothetical protein
MNGLNCNYTQTFLNGIISRNIGKVIVICCDIAVQFLSSPYNQVLHQKFICGTPDFWSFLYHLNREKPFTVSSFYENKFMIVFDVTLYKSLRLLERGQKQGYKIDDTKLTIVAVNTIEELQKEILQLERLQQDHIADNDKQRESTYWMIDRIETRKQTWTQEYKDDMQNPDFVKFQDRIVKDYEKRMSEFDEQICTYRDKMAKSQQNCDQSVQKLQKKIDRSQKIILDIRGKYNL